MSQGQVSVDNRDLVRSTFDHAGVTTSWGHLSWLLGAGSEPAPGVEQTFGVVTIQPGKRNPLHAHPNCEELLFVISGTCDHLLGEDVFQLRPGSVIRIPRDIPHWAKCTSEEPLRVVVSFSSPDRLTTNLEDEEIA
jgi:quercetin dioxygenase-like cupin family protein